MENAADALKIAFSVLMFVMALTLGMSSFSEANRAVKAIVTQRDRETEYTYVEPSEDLTRIVGIDTVIPTMYQAYRENIAIYFFDTDGKTPLPIFYKIDIHNGERVKDSYGNPIKINYIDSSKESYGATENKTGNENAIEHLDILLQGKVRAIDTIYENQILHDQGLYNYLKDKRFKEKLGEYTQNEGAGAIEKRVITYVLQ